LKGKKCRISHTRVQSNQQDHLKGLQIDIWASNTAKREEAATLFMETKMMIEASSSYFILSGNQHVRNIMSIPNLVETKQSSGF